MPSPTQLLQSLLPVAAIGLLGVSLAVYGNVIRRLRAAGGRVDPTPFGRADFAVAIIAVAWFAHLGAGAFAATPRALSEDDLYAGAALIAGIACGLGAFLYFRGRSPWALFGLRPGRLPGAILPALGMVAAALPAVILVGGITQYLLGPAAKPQEIVQFLVDSSRAGDWRALAGTLLMGAAVAPASEEFIFRGYLYGALKRFAGFPFAALATAALFALVHGNAAAAPALFLLALALSAGYELTGSLWVPTIMHAVFNATMMLLLLIFGGRALP